MWVDPKLGELGLRPILHTVCPLLEAIENQHKKHSLAERKILFILVPLWRLAWCCIHQSFHSRSTRKTL